MVSKLSQRLRVRAALSPADISTAKTSPFISIAGAGQLMVAVTTGAVTATKKITLQILQAVDAAGTGAKALGPAVDKVAASTAPQELTSEAYTERLDDGFSFVAVQLSSDNGSAVTGAAVLIQGDNRFKP